MKFPVELIDDVEYELEKAAEWVEQQREGYGIKLIEAFENAVRNLSSYPLSYSTKHRNYRIMKL